jgi:hypothetical protein
VAKAIRKQSRKATKDEHLPLERSNYMIIGLGVILIAAGYLAMGEGSVEGFLSLSLAPILLVIGYCVVVPFGILYRKGMFKRRESSTSSSEPSS